MAKIVPSVGDAQQRRSWKGPLRNVVLVLLLVVLAGGAGAGVRWLQQRGNKSEPLEKLPATVSDIQELRFGDNPEDADKKIDEALGDESLDNKTRYELYLQKGHSAAGKQDFKAAIEAYKMAEQIDATHMVAWVLGDMYRQLGDKEQAISYYNKAAERVPDSEPLADSDREYLRKLAQDLEATEQ